MATINFKYEYPYFYFDNKAKYGVQWANTLTSINGNNTYPVVFNSIAPNCLHIEVDVEITNTGSGSVFGIQWEFKIYRNGYGWYTLETFTMPSNGCHSVAANINNYSVKQFACVPKSQQSSSKKWSTGYTLKSIIITEQLTLGELQTGVFHYGVFPNYYGIEESLTEVNVNIDGVLKKAADILVNIGDEMISLSSVKSTYMKTSSEIMKLFKFTPTSTGQYRIKAKRLSGDHEIRLYSSNLTLLYDGYFYDRSFELTGGSVYYITFTHYYDAK